MILNYALIHKQAHRDIKIYLSCINKAKKNEFIKNHFVLNDTKKIYRLKESKIALEKINYLPNISIYIISSKKIKKNLKIYSGDIKAKIVVNKKENIDIDYKKDYISASKFKKL